MLKHDSLWKFKVVREALRWCFLLLVFILFIRISQVELEVEKVQVGSKTASLVPKNFLWTPIFCGFC